MSSTAQPARAAQRSASSPGSGMGDPELTIPRMLRRTAQRHGDREALLHKVDGKFRPITYRELAERVRDFAAGLVELGVQPGDRIALLSENRPEWAITDLAAVSLGAVNVPLYTTLPPPQVEYIVADSESQILIVSNDKQLDKALEIRGNLPRLKQILVMDPPATLPEGVTTMAEVSARGKASETSLREVQRRSDAVRPEELATIIYTSGTTGAPKGAMLTHRNFMSNAQGVEGLVDIRPDDLFLSFLPLSHVFERMAGHYLPLLAGSCVAYAEGVYSVQSNMVELKPTVMASVPRLYESIHSRVLDGIAKQPEKKRRFAEWALKIGWERNRCAIRGDRPPFFAGLLYGLAEAKVLKPLRDRITGGRLRFFISGGAPLPVQTAEFFTSLGLVILEGYGLTETSPVICVNLPGKVRLGTVGPAIQDVEVRIAPDGEILSRGPHIMQGYFNKPEDTAQAIDAEGWFHTGDIGRLDDDGYLKITDRKKDIIVLANGKNVAPQPIEAKVKASQYVTNIVLFGDREPQVVALIVPDFEHLKQWARQQGIEAKDPESLIADPKVKKFFRQEVERTTGDLADFEKIRRFTLLPRDFSQERGEVTPTLKIKRREVAKNYADEIRALYGGKSE